VDPSIGAKRLQSGRQARENGTHRKHSKGSLPTGIRLPLGVLARLVALRGIDAEEAEARATWQRQRVAVGDASGHALEHRRVALRCRAWGS